MNKQNILVTGGSGLLGTELIKQLLNVGPKPLQQFSNHTPLPSFENNPNLTSIKCDILDPSSLEEAMKGITHLYHSAAIVSFSPKQRKNYMPST